MAYNFIPKTPGEVIRGISNADIAADIVVALNYLQTKYPSIEDPITIDLQKLNSFNITRKLDGHLNKNELTKMLKKTTFKFGEGSRGGRGTANKGNLFEVQLKNDLETWRDGGEIKSTTTLELINDLIKTYGIDKWGRFSVLDEAYKNQKRPLVITGRGAVVSPGLIDIGSTVTDLTLKSEDENKVVYLSLKYSGTVTFFNAGTKKYLSDAELQKGEIKNPGGKVLLDLFGIDNKTFCSVFNGKGKNFNSENTLAKIDKAALEKLIQSGIGYGYHMVHKMGAKMISKKVDKMYRDNASTIIGCKVYYGGKTGTGKRVDIEVATPKYDLKFNFRNKQGGNYISHLMCDYSYR